MRLSCPSCGAEYELPDTLFAAGPRKVRCVKCGHAWTAGGAVSAAPPPGPAAAAEELPPRRPLPLRRRTQAAEPPIAAPDLSLDPPALPQSGRGVTLAWAASLVILATVCWAGWQYRADVIAAWPASARLFGVLGG